MTWFKSTTAPDGPRRLDIPETHVEKFWELLDQFWATGDKQNKYRLWKFIFEILPEAKQHGACSLDTDNIMRPRIVLDNN